LQRWRTIPGTALTAVVRFLAGDLFTREAGERRSSSRTSSGRTGVRSTTSSGSTPARTRWPAPPRWVCWSKRNHPGE